MLRPLFVLLLLCAACHFVWGQRCGLSDTIDISAFGETEVVISIENYLNNDIANGNQGLCGLSLYFQHSYVYDLTVTLTSPSGQSVELIGPINAQARPSTNLARWFIDFLPCDSTAAPDPGAPGTWNNNFGFDWPAFGLFRGDYHPAAGCFEDFTAGPVNGDWTLTFNTQRAGQQGRLTYVLLEFCDDRNSEGPCCFANAGEIEPDPPFETCELGSDLPLDLPSRYRQPRPAADQYGYTYAIARNDSVLFVQDSPNLANLPAGSYEICGLSYRQGELGLLPLDGSLSFNELRQDFAGVNPTLCADLTPVCQLVTLYPIPDTTFLDRTICVGGSVPVGGMNFSTTDIHVVNLSGRAGCDSVVVLDLEVVTELRETVDTTICAESFYPLDGQQYDLPGTYVDTILSVLGCDSIVTLNLAVAPPIITDTLAAICVGDTFFIGTEPFVANVDTTIIIPAANGCDSTVNLNLAVLAPSIVFNPLPLGLDCAVPNITLDASGSNLAFTQSVRWLDMLGNVLTPDLSLTVDTAGTFIFELTVGTRGVSCTVRDTVVLADFRFRVATDLALTQVQCNGPEEQCAFISCRNPNLGIRATPAPAGPAYTYLWSAPPGGNIISATDGPEILVDAPGRYELTIVDPVTSCRLDTFYQVGLDTLLPLPDFNGNFLLNCERSNLQFVADTFQPRREELDFVWTGDCLPNQINGPVLAIDCPGSITLTVSNRTNGCSVDTTFTVQQDLAPVNLSLAPAAAPITCFAPLSTLDASGSTSANGLEFVWTYESFADTVSQASLWDTNLAGTYTLTATDQRSRCSATSTIFIPGDTIHPIAEAGPPIIDLNCFRPDTILGNTLTSTGPEFSYAWTEISRPFDTLGRTPTLVVTPPAGIFRLSVLDETNGCQAVDSVLLRVALDTPFLRLALPLEFDCFVDSVQLDASQTTLNFPFTQNWSGPCLPAATDSSRIWVECPGAYVYEVLNLESGCSARDSVMVGLAATGVVALLPDTAFLDCDTGVTRLDRSAGTDAPVVRWFRDGTPINLIGQTPQVAVPGVYTLVLGNFNESCLDTARTVVVANCSALAVIVPPDSLTCNTAVVNLDASASVPNAGPNVVSEWFIPAGATTLPGTSDRELSVFSPGRYGFALRNLISGAADTIFVVVRRNILQPIVDAGPRDTINCYDPTVILNAEASSQGPEFEYLWTTTTDDTLGFTQQITVEEPGTYLLRVTQRETGCSRVDNVTIRRDLAVPNLSFTEAIIPCDTTDFALGVIPDPPGDYSYEWNGPAIVAHGDRDTVRITDVGTYQVRVTDISNGCPTSDLVAVTRAACPPFPELADTSLTCKADTLLLVATFRAPCLGCNYRWTRNGVPIPDQNDSILPVSRVGTYEIIVFNSFGLRGAATGTVTDTRILPTTNAGPDQLLSCSVTSVVLGDPVPEPDFPFSYQWYNERGAPIPGATTDSLRVSGGTFYQLETRNLFSDCVALDTVAINYDTIAPISNAGTPRILDCNNKRRTLDGINSSLGDRYRYSWSGGPSELCLEGEATLNPIVRCGGAYTLLVRDTVNGCSAVSQVQVANDDELPVAIPLPDVFLDCSMDTAFLAGRPVGLPDRDYRWEEILPGGNQVVAEVSPGLIEVTAAGTFRFFVENTITGCTNDFTVAVTADLNYPTAEAGMVDTFYCALDSLLVRGSGATVSGHPPIYRWDSNTGFFIDRADSTVGTIFQPDTYYFSVTDPRNSCTSSDSVLIARDIEAPLAFAGNDTTLTCDRRELRLDGDWQTLSGQANFFWTTRDGNILSGDQSLNPLVDTMGRYQLNVVDPINDCLAADIVRVTEDTISPIGSLNLPQGSELDCFRPDLRLVGRGGQAAVNYEWRGPQGEVLGNNREASTTEAGLHQLIVTARRNGCRDTLSFEITEDFTAPTAFIATTEPLTCQRDSVVLRVRADSPTSPFYRYRWLSPSNEILGEGPSRAVFAVGTYQLVTQNILNGCRDTTRIFVDANQTEPVVNLAEPLVLNCFRSFATIDGSGSSRGGDFTSRWESPNNSAIPSADPYQVRGSVPGFYHLTVTNRNNGCSATDSVELIQSALAVDDLEIEVEQPACIDDPTGSLMILGVNGGQPPFRYRLDEGLLTDRLLYEGLPTGRYSVEAVGADGCSATTSFSIVEGPSVFLDLREDTLIRLGDSIPLDFTTNLLRWDTLIWTSSGPLPNLNTDGPITVRPISSQGYRLLIIGPDGCTATDETVIEVDGTVRTFVPTAFSPNEDGRNDKIRPFFGAEVESLLDFKIYDRWGELLYNYQEDPNQGGEEFGWDGRHKGKMMNPQVFIWSLEALLVDGEIIQEKGDFVLVR